MTIILHLEKSNKNNLFPTKTNDDYADLLFQECGSKKREESMQRLLEWKQKMLQSPLTRKGATKNVYGDEAAGFDNRKYILSEYYRVLILRLLFF